MRIKKILTMSTFLLACPPIASVISASNSTHTQINNPFKMSKKDNVLETRHFLVDEKYDPNTISLKQMQKRVNQVEDKLQFELRRAGLVDTDVKTNVGKFEAKINQKISQYSASNDGELTQKGIDAVYAYVNDQANELGIQVADYYEIANNNIPTTTLSYYNALLANGYSESDATNEAQNFKDELICLLDEADEQLWDSFHYALALQEFADDNNSQNQEDSVLATVLSYASTSFCDTLTVNQGFDALKLLADYSDNGQGLTVSDTPLSDEQITKLFNFKYDLTEGCDFSDYRVWDIDPSTEGGDIPSTVVEKLSVTKPLDTFSGYSANFGKNEIYPGYKLNVKINSIENNEDSHKCNIQFKFGICKSSNPTYILWQDDKMLAPDKNGNKSNFVYLDISDMRLISNISKNKYSRDYEISYCKLDEKPNKKGIYFENSDASRTYLNEIMAKYTGDSDTYDLKKNPIILTDPADYAGIPTPSNVNDSYHTNQIVALVARDIDTINNVLTLSWAYVDTNISKNNENLKITNNNFLPIKYIPWKTKKENLDSIKVQYKIDPNLQKLLDCGTGIATTISSLGSIFDMVLSATSKEDAFGLLTADIDTRIVLYSLIVAANAVAVATELILTAQVVATYGYWIFKPVALFQIAMCAAFIALSVYLLTVMGIKISADHQALNNMKFIYDIVNENNENKQLASELIPISKDDDFIKYAKTLQNEHGTYSAKEDAANKVIEFSKSIRDEKHWNFYGKIYQRFTHCSDDELNKHKNEFLNPLNTNDNNLSSTPLISEGSTAFWTIFGSDTGISLLSFATITGLPTLAYYTSKYVVAEWLGKLGSKIEEIEQVIEKLTNEGICFLEDDFWYMSKAEKELEAARLTKRVEVLTKQQSVALKIEYWADRVAVIGNKCILAGVIIPGAVATILDVLFNIAYDHSEKISTYFYFLLK